MIANAILPISALTSRSDRFRCTELHATLSAAVCVERQTARHEGKSSNQQDWFKFPFCASCTVGREVAARVPAKHGPVCAVCGVPVRGAGKRTPLCPEHRKAVP